MLAPRFYSRIGKVAALVAELDIKWESDIYKVVPNYGQSRGCYPFLLLRKDGKPLLAEHRHYASVRRAKEAAEREACVQKTTDTADHHTGPEQRLTV